MKGLRFLASRSRTVLHGPFSPEDMLWRAGGLLRRMERRLRPLPPPYTVHRIPYTFPSSTPFLFRSSLVTHHNLLPFAPCAPWPP
jgi:hypothetical protein